MAQRATKFAKKTSRHVEVAGLARLSGEPKEELRAVPLDILPLLQPFKKRGRLSVRVEKLPILARLSAGRNNGDRSYSLMTDELEDLQYLAPPGTDPRPVLSVRIIALDEGAASTIAVREVTVEFGEEENAGEIDFANISNDDLRRLIEELTRVKSTLSLREAELNEIRSKSALQSEAQKGSAEALLAEARAAWQIEMEEKIAKVKAEAAANLERGWAAWQAEQEKKSRTALDIDKERLRWQQESLAAIAKAEKEWKSAEAARFAAAEAKWREHTEHQVEKVRASSKAMREHGDAIELRRLREELLSMQNLLAERDSEIAELRASRETKTQQCEIEAALAKAQKEWKEAEATRFAVAEAQWKERAEKVIAAAQSQTKAEREEGELRKWREEADALKTKLAARERELTEARASADGALRKAEQEWRARETERIAVLQTEWQEKTAKAIAEAHAQARAELAKERQRWTKEAEAQLAKAENAWKLREADRLAAAEAQWQQQSAGALADARAQVKAARDKSEIELARLRTELTIVQTKLSEREAALSEARVEIERVREEAKAALANAETAWRSEEAARLSAVEKRLREQAGSALTEAEAARSEAENELRQLREQSAILETTLADRELELAQAIARINATERQLEELRENEDIQVRRIRGEMAALEAKLAEREEELAQARLFTERSYERWQKQAEAELAKAQKAWKSAEASRLAAARAEWQEESRRALQEALETERRAGRLPPVHTPEDAVSADIAGITENKPMPVFAPPEPGAPPPLPKKIIADARNAADEALERLAMDAYQLLASANSIDTVSPTDTAIIKGGFVERRRNQARESDRSTWTVAGAAAGVAALVAVAVFFLWPSSNGAGEAVQQAPVAAAVQAPPPKPAPVEKATLMRSMNLRSGPSTSYAVVTTLKAGESVILGERNGSWIHIRIDDAKSRPVYTGWVLASAVQAPAETAKTVEPVTPGAAQPEVPPPAEAPKPLAQEPPPAPVPEPAVQPAESAAVESQAPEEPKNPPAAPAEEQVSEPAAAE